MLPLGSANHKQPCPDCCPILKLKLIRAPSKRCFYFLYWKLPSSLRLTDLQIHVTFASILALPVFSAPSLSFSDADIGYHSPHKLHYLNKTWFGSKDIVLSSVFNYILDEKWTETSLSDAIFFGNFCDLTL